MGYAVVDPTIKAWTQKHGFTLFDRAEGHPTAVRCVYLSSPDGECFQIWIDEPEGGHIGLHAAEVETRSNEQLRQDWSVSVESLRAALEEAVVHVRKWMARK